MSRRRSSSAAGAVVVITGAARGMGELYARRAADEGAAAIALWDMDPDGLARLQFELEALGARVHSTTVDISDRVAVETAAARMLAEIGVPDILVNNAGIVRGKVFWEHDSERDIEATLRVNTLAPMWLTRALLPAMLEDAARAKRILNIASAAGTLANPNMSVYAASKWAMIGWSDSLRLELERIPGGNVAVTTFLPSYVSTGMFSGARGPLLTPIMRPEAAVEAAWRGMLAGAPIVAKPWTVKLAMALRGVLPTGLWDLIADRVFKVYSSMDHFTGRGPGS